VRATGGAKQAATTPETLLLVGNPNVGKSVVFGLLTGRYVHVSNYPGTTIEVTRSGARLAGSEVSVVDTPGVNRLTPRSEDERVTRNLILESPGCPILQIADAKNLPRALLLTSELAELGAPLALALNMQDEARARGVQINVAELAARLGIPIVETVAIEAGAREATERAAVAATPPSSLPSYPAEVEAAIAEATFRLAVVGMTARFVAIQLLSGDGSIADDVASALAPEIRPTFLRAATEVRTAYGEGYALAISAARHRWVDGHLAGNYHTQPEERASWSGQISRWALHPLRGALLLGSLLYATLWFVGLFGAGTLVDLMENGVFGQVVNPAAIRLIDAVFPFAHEHAQETIRIDLELPLTPAHSLPLGLGWERTVPSTAYEAAGAAGAVVAASTWTQVARFIHDFLVGPYGILTMAVSYGIAIVLPIVLTFFLVFSFLEDSGYLPRLAVMLHRVFRMMGLNGKAVLPMVLGLGCDTMATMTARILETRQQRLIVTLLLALAVPCSAQLGVLLAMMASISFLGAAIWVGLMIAIMISVGFLASKIFPGERGDFLLEIPPIRRPVFGNIVVKTSARLEWYLKEVVPLFILGTILLFVLDRTHGLALLRDLASPVVVRWLGLPIETTDAFIVGFLRRDYGAVLLLQAGTAATLTAAQVLVCMVVITLFVPCVANVFMIAKEHGWKTAVAMTGFIFPFAFFVGGCLRFAIQALRLPV